MNDVQQAIFKPHYATTAIADQSPSAECWNFVVDEGLLQVTKIQNSKRGIQFRSKSMYYFVVFFLVHSRRCKRRRSLRKLSAMRIYDFFFVSTSIGQKKRRDIVIIERKKRVRSVNSNLSNNGRRLISLSIIYVHTIYTNERIVGKFLLKMPITFSKRCYVLLYLHV